MNFTAIVRFLIAALPFFTLQASSSDLLRCAKPVGEVKLQEFFVPCETAFPDYASRVLRVLCKERAHYDGNLNISGIETKVKVEPGNTYCVTAIGKLCSQSAGADVKIFVKQGNTIISSAEPMTTDYRILTLTFEASASEVVIGLGAQSNSPCGSFEAHKFTLDLCNGCSPKRLNIVLTNDDGYNDVNMGIQTLAGVLSPYHNVYVVAPYDRVDACSFAINTPDNTIPDANSPFALIEPQNPAAPGVLGTWSVRQAIFDPETDTFTPGETVFPVGAITQFPVVVPVTPDLIIAGINSEGTNTGQATLNSGTVANAATVMSRAFANFLAVPSISVSGPGVNALNTDIANFVLNLVTQLQCSKFYQESGQLLPEFTTLNINYPDTTVMPLLGVRITRQGLVTEYIDGIPVGAAYTQFAPPTPEGAIITVLGLAPMPPSEQNDIPDSDSLANAQGYITITPLSPFLTADPCQTRQVIDALAQLQPAFGTYLPANIEIPFSACNKR